MTQDILCFSHLRWHFVHQRPQHLMNIFGRDSRVFFFEEPVFDADTGPCYFDISRDNDGGVRIVVPHLAPGLSEEKFIEQQQTILAGLLEQQQIHSYISWYYSPMAWTFTTALEPLYIVYDCMDELSAFLFAPPSMKDNERLLLHLAGAVFTGGRSLYEAKKDLHANIHCFPSSIDKDHFRKARIDQPDPEDQRNIPYPRIGFYGVIDERLNIALLDEVSAARPKWQFVLVGPVVKIDPATLPNRENIHYLGSKKYLELPAYLAGWDIAMMPFALNASTAFISPTKTPEYLAGGKRVISPSITDVVSPYGELGLVTIADTGGEFIAGAEEIFNSDMEDLWLEKVDSFLSDQSWEKTAAEMKAIIKKGIDENIKNTRDQKTESYV